MEAAMKGWMLCGIVATVAVLGACGSDSGRLLGVDPAASRGPNGGGTDTSGNSGQTSNGPVASISVVPGNLTVFVGASGLFVADARDAAGVRVNKAATWKSSDESVARVDANGIVTGKAVGKTTVTAEVDGRSAEGNVVVMQPVSEFNLTIVVGGPIPGADTSRVEPVAGATVSLLRTGGITGDTLLTPEPAGSAVTDANGQAVFKKLKAGYYAIRIVPPAGSPYVETSTGVLSAAEPDITRLVTLIRR